MNVVHIINGLPREVQERTVIESEYRFPKLIKEMEAKETGFTVPWAYGAKGLNPGFVIHSGRGGTLTLWVMCVEKHKYIIEFT